MQGLLHSPFFLVSNTDTSTQIYHSALGLLTRREHSRYELQQKLLQRFPDASAVIQPVLARLEEEGYQSDGRFIEAYIRSRQNKGYGLQRLRQELRLRGLDNQLVDQAFAQMTGDDRQIDSLIQLWRKKFRQLPENPREKARQINFLRYRGFSTAEIESMFRYLAEHES